MVTSSMPQVAVVVLTWNDGELLAQALASVLSSTAVTVEVVVVDNASDPPATVPGDPRVRLLRNATNLGVAAARNQGVAHTSSPLVCLLDSDARLEPRALACLAGAVVADPSVALAAPVFVGQLPEASAGMAPTPGRKVLRVLGATALYAEGSGHDGAEWDVDFAIGACQLFRREAFDAVGGLDAAYFYGPEDVDFCLRLREAGWRVVQVAGAAVHHPARRRARGLLTRKGLAHAWAVTRHLWRHRGFARKVGRPSR